VSAFAECWSEYANTNVENGQQVSSANTVEACQDACEENSECNGVDFVSGASEGQRCWMSGPWSGNRNDGGSQGTTHYDLDRNCIVAGNLHPPSNRRDLANDSPTSQLMAPSTFGL